MDALEAILSRRVQRAFADKPVEREKLSKIVDAGRHAMSARNMQPWQFVVVRKPETLKEIGALENVPPAEKLYDERFVQNH